MAFPAESPVPPTPVRPVQVKAAVWCLYVLAATQILSIITTISTMGPSLDATRDYVEGTRDGDAIIASVQIGSYISLAFAVIFAIGLVVLALFVNRRSQPARIVSWVVLGLMLCCNGFGLLGAAAGGLLSGAGSTGEIDQEELARRVEDAVPGWATSVSYVLLFIGIVASAAGIILLALPAANEYFRRAQPTWEPPVPGAYYGPAGAPGSGGAAPGTPAAGAPAAPAGPAPAGGSTPEAPFDSTRPAEPGSPASSDESDPRPGNPPPAL